MIDFIIVLTTFGNAEDAAKAARALVEERLAACANIVPNVRSIYRWEGKIQDEAEVLCILKSRRELFPRLKERLTALHPYEVPEVLALEIADGAEKYLAWLKTETGA